MWSLYYFANKYKTEICQIKHKIVIIITYQRCTKPSLWAKYIQFKLGLASKVFNSDMHFGDFTFFETILSKSVQLKSRKKGKTIISI